MVLSCGRQGASSGAGAPHQAISPTGSPASSSPTSPSPTSTAPTSPPVIVPSAPGFPPFRLVVATGRGDLPARVVGMDVASGEPVDPPHGTAAEWNTAVFVRAAAYPAAPSTGTTYVYGHACRWHTCPFTELRRVKVGDRIRVQVATGQLTYRVSRIGLSPRSATYLPSWARDSTVRDRIVLVTCAFEPDDTSVNNIVVVATLVSAARR